MRLYSSLLRFITWSKKNNSLKLAVKNQQQLFWNILANIFPKVLQETWYFLLGTKFQTSCQQIYEKKDPITSYILRPYYIHEIISFREMSWS